MTTSKYINPSATFNNLTEMNHNRTHLELNMGECQSAIEVPDVITGDDIIRLVVTDSAKTYYQVAMKSELDDMVERGANLTADRVPRATGANTVIDGIIRDDGARVGMGRDPSATHLLDVDGSVLLRNKLAFFSGLTEYPASSTQSFIFRTHTDAGSFPFDSFGHLVIMPRTSDGRSVVIVSGTTPGPVAEFDHNQDTRLYNNLQVDEIAGIGTAPVTGQALTVAGGVYLPAANFIFFGAEDADGTWKMGRSGDDFIFQRREAGSYVTKSTIAAA